MRFYLNYLINYHSRFIITKNIVKIENAEEGNLICTPKNQIKLLVSQSYLSSYRSKKYY
jgi:hypothetical protein